MVWFRAELIAQGKVFVLAMRIRVCIGRLQWLSFSGVAQSRGGWRWWWGGHDCWYTRAGPCW